MSTNHSFDAIPPPVKTGGLLAVFFDPFMGSGTVGRVAKKLNRQFVGFELNPDYYRECVAALTAV